ncbi:MAG: ShlB/FhaC/HecB family hemolysin secretion/activation protein, partial [Phycisphaerales bacterium]|nr:ShlB/FhaC/HecB family hemolysin secretion/activation protein [Phycisphaerales bacterium]
EWTTLGQMTVPSADERYYASAVQWILESILGWYTEHEYITVFVAPDPADITPESLDVRPAGRTAVGIVISTGIVTELRTLASGERVRENGTIHPSDRINNPKHERHRLNSPVRPFDPERDEMRHDLLRGDVLNEYMYHLSRHPGRRVDASIAAAEQPGTAALDYIITENPPLTIYGQVANTGTKSTSYWRERIGFFHTQLTENDDILSADYTTAQFDQTHAFQGSYEAPFGDNQRLRWRVNGNWSQYDSEEVGFFNTTFQCESWGVGAEVIANVYQDRQFFLDLLAGVRYADHEVTNPFVGTGNESFLIPYVGAQIEKTTDWYDTHANVTFEFQVSDPDMTELNRLGRTSPDDNWTVMRWNAFHSFYLEPVLDREAWEDPFTPASSTLAHEIRATFRGQYAFGNRLIPQEEGVLGGLYSVRGYPQSVVAGDSTLVGSLEYRYHVPRAFGIESEPLELFGQPFRRSPQFVYGTPDWDLILKGFVDVGRTIQSDRLSFERDETLIGAGVGVEFLYRRNLNVRLDWGFVLEGLDSQDVNDGSNRLHLVVTILF